MNCPFCHSADTRVIDSRPADGGHAVRRRRTCAVCSERFSTYERPIVVAMVRKRTGELQPFDSAKVRRGIENALADRPVPEESIANLVSEIDTFAHAGGAQITAEDIGQRVLSGLRAIDEVGYLRFASVYKEFQGADDFEREMAALDEPTDH
ncbi:MAG: transcriptional repressor NrdR [Acidimicrobiia bacterium]|nr:transcriptional regulator NrdR [Acidimicrobiia bacterium]NNF65341.1 transcriptional repressor NrdR [Acidimicrobiia bacterium]